jgi:hypothetical protein
MTTTRHDGDAGARATGSLRQIEVAAWLLLVTQVVHGFVPADTEAEGYVGLVGGLALLLATMAAIVGLRTRRGWAAPLAGWTGLVVAVGFVLYHAVPVRSPMTNPYLGEPVGAPAWISVAAAIAAGAWTAYLALRPVRPT